MIRVLSLFTGAGGLDIGFHEAGFKVVGCVEIDKPSCDTLKANVGRYVDADCLIVNEDITKVEPSQLGLENIDFIIGGPPCQSFSAAGRRAGGVTGINDTRGSLFWYYCQFIKHFQPKGFLFENVRGILQANSLKDWEIIKESFTELGYKLSYRVLDAADYGVPQHRERLIMVGSKEGITFKFPRPLFGPDSKLKKPHITVGQAFSDLDNPNEIVPPYGGKYGDLLPDIPPGMNYLFYTEKMGHPDPKFAWRSKFSDFLYKLNPNSTSKTVVASQGRYGGPFHWRNRKLTVPELKRIQSFPDDYIFVGHHNVAAKQIGNSVAPKFAQCLSQAVKNQFFNGTFEVEYQPEETSLTFDKRKGKKAKETRGKTVSVNNSSQMSIFDAVNEIEWPTLNLNDEIGYTLSDTEHRFTRLMTLDNGSWDIEVSKNVPKHLRKSRIDMILDFNRPIVGAFRIIKATLYSDTVWNINVLWDAIHDCISGCTSYEGVQPLYGHFTEPYPQFVLKVDAISENENGITNFINSLSNFSQLSETTKLDSLKKYAEGESLYDFVLKLRQAKFDLRVHETNRAIPEGHFKICYPFTLYSKGHSYVVWSEKGSHKTGDVKVIKTKSGYKVYEYNK